MDGKWELILHANCDRCGAKIEDTDWVIVNHGGFVIARPNDEQVQGSSTECECPDCGYLTDVHIDELLS